MENYQPHQRLKEIFEQKSQDSLGSVIAITGSWGIGKTYFWNNFIQEEFLNEEKKINEFYYYASKLSYNSIFQKKYAYVSLFGLESLSDIKSVIYDKLEIISTKDKKSFSTYLKSILTSIKEARINHSGLNISTKLLDTFLFSNVRDVIICLDDFERISNKLSIKDVMGLINFLKLERNCDIILILDEDKTKNELNKSYQEYKEKIIDAEVKINNLEPLIRNFAVEMDDSLIKLILKFSDVFDIKNFRFFQKVINLYFKLTRANIYKIPTYTKEMFLVRILQGYFIEDFGSIYEYDWTCNRDFSERHIEKWSEIKQETYKKFYNFSYYSRVSDVWSEQFINWFSQSKDYDESKINELVRSDLISEENMLLKNKINELMFEWRNIDMKSDFCERLYTCANKLIGSENLSNLDFYRHLLSTFDRSDLSLELRSDIKKWIDHSMQEKGDEFIESMLWFGFDKKNMFHRYIRILSRNNPHWGLPSLNNVVNKYIINSGWNKKYDIVLKNSTSQDWYDLLFESIPKDKDLKDIHKTEIITKMINQEIDPSLNSQIKKDILDALERKAKESNIMRLNVNYIISTLDS